MIRSLTQTSTLAALFFGLVLSVTSAHATRVDNFVLLDHKGTPTISTIIRAHPRSLLWCKAMAAQSCATADRLQRPA